MCAPQPSLCCCAGVHQDNRVQPRPGQPQQKGMRFFADDEDAFGLEDLLQVSANMTAVHSRWPTG